MTIQDLFEREKLTEDQKKLVFCDLSTRDGFQINSLDEFVNYLKYNKDILYIANESVSEKVRLFDFFKMEKVEPYLVFVKHPYMTNAYYKILPDKFNETYISLQDNIYRYLTVSYSHGIKEYVIELPQNIEKPIYDFFKSIVKTRFLGNNYRNIVISMVFTNSNRYKLFAQNNSIILPYNEVYKAWDVKSITSFNLSSKVWKDIKSIGK